MLSYVYFTFLHSLHIVIIVVMLSAIPSAALGAVMTAVGDILQSDLI